MQNVRRHASTIGGRGGGNPIINRHPNITLQMITASVDIEGKCSIQRYIYESFIRTVYASQHV